MALAGDVAFVDELGEVVEDASDVQLAETLAVFASSAGQSDSTNRLADLFDVDLETTPPVDNDVLSWDEATAMWVAKTPGGGTDAATLTGLAPDSTGAANAHVPVTEADGTLKVASLDVSGAGNLPYMMKAGFNLTGGGTVSCTR